MTLHHTCCGEDWGELDAIVDDELDRALARRAGPVAEPEVGEALFLDRAMSFLAEHDEPLRLISELQTRLAARGSAEPEQADAGGDPGGDGSEPSSPDDSGPSEGEDGRHEPL
jgi:hypothetical protein